MNDDFLRRVRRPPSAAFERELSERLRQQELSETSRRRPSWKLLAISLFVGGAALATATYISMTRAPSPRAQTAPPENIVAPAPGPEPEVEINRFGYGPNPQTWTPPPSTSASPPQQEDVARTAADTQSRSQSSATTSSSVGGGVSETTRYVASTGAQSSGTTRPIRVVVTPDIEPLIKDAAPESANAPGVVFEVDSADKALPALCAREPEEQPDVVVTSRRAIKKEFELCRRHYTDVLETTLGHVATVVSRAKSGMPMFVSTRSLRLALLKRVPSPDNASLLVDNPYTHWNQIDPSLEDTRIKVLGPARDSAEFLVFAATLLDPACDNFSNDDKQMCHTLREDGVYEEARFDGNFIRQRLWSDPNIVAVMSYRFYDLNRDDLLDSVLLGATPTREAVVDGNYAGTRSIHIYVNRMRYRNIPKVSSFVTDYLRRATLYTKGRIPPDGNFDWRRYDSVPQLTEVNLD